MANDNITNDELNGEQEDINTPVETPSNNDDATITFPIPDSSVQEPETTDANVEFEKFKMKINFYKWVLGTFAIAIITIIINWGFKDRAVGMNEISAYDRYATDMIILNDNPVKKRMLAQFFATVTPSDKLKDGWQEYYEEVNKDYVIFMQNDSIVQKKYFELIKKDTSKLNTIDKIKLDNLIQEKQQNDLIKDAPIITPTIEQKTIRPTIYFQYSNRNKKSDIEKLRQTFQNNNWKVPVAEWLKNNCNNTIRYFNNQDLGIANQANKLLENKFKVEKVIGNAPVGQIEIWINNN